MAEQEQSYAGKPTRISRQANQVSKVGRVFRCVFVDWKKFQRVGLNATTN